MDRARFSTLIISEPERVIEEARKVYPMDKFGAVRITPVIFTDPYGENIPRTFEWEAASDWDSCLEYSGEYSEESLKRKLAKLK